MTTTTTDIQTAMTLELRIINILLAGGFTGATRFTSGSEPAFHVSEGVGATVVLSWQASKEDRSEMLARYEQCLTAAGLRVENRPDRGLLRHRGHYLYVHKPCPPSAVVDMIVTWSEVQEGDLVLVNEQFVLALEVSTYEDDWQGTKWMRTDLRYQGADGRAYVTDKWAHRDYTAVRRYDLSDPESEDR